MSEHFPSDEDSEELSESWPTNVTTFGSRASTLTDVDTVVGAELFSTENRCLWLGCGLLSRSRLGLRLHLFAWKQLKL